MTKALEEPMDVSMWRVKEKIEDRLKQRGFISRPQCCWNCLYYNRQEDYCSVNADTVPAEFTAAYNQCEDWAHEEDYPF